MTLEELKIRCKNNVNLMAWACGVSERQMRNYLNKNELPPQRAALAALNTSKHIKKITLIRKR